MNIIIIILVVVLLFFVRFYQIFSQLYKKNKETIRKKLQNERAALRRINYDGNPKVIAYHKAEIERLEALLK